MENKEIEILILQDGRGILYLPLPLYRRFRDAILIVIPAMIPETGYKAEHLLGTEIWSTLDTGGRRVAGRCISHMVRHGRLPLRRVGCRHQHPAQYEVTT